MFKGWDKVLQFHVHNTMMNHRNTGYILLLLQILTHRRAADIYVYA